MDLLSNNSPQMATVVETFITEETAGLIYDNEELDRWNNHVTQLNLKGQSNIIQKDKSPIPFLHLKTSMINVFETLCPRKVEVEEYNITPIPLQILDLVALSVREGYFTKIQIWYDEASPDPVCIGKRGCWGIDNPGGSRIKGLSFVTQSEAKEYIDTHDLTDHKPYDYSYSDSNYYLLGKWGDVKHSFPELKAMAHERYVAEQGNKYKKEIITAQRALDDLQTTTFDRFN